MTALAIIGCTLLMAFIGLCVGMQIGDRKSQYLDFGMPVLLGALIGVVLGGLIGVIVGSVVFT